MEPKVLTPAATIILTRQHAGTLQVYLLKRSAESGFMAGKYVFPGGILDAGDQDAALWADHVDMDMEAISQRIGGGLTVNQALSFGIAAIRETFEEAGVFLALTDRRDPADLEKICAHRKTPDFPEGWFWEKVVSHEWVLTVSRLCRWSHWVTPTLMKRRYDTRFFLASMPSGQDCLPDNRETTHGLWVSPEKALSENLTGEIPLSPPTLVTLHGLLKYKSLEKLLIAALDRPWGEMIFPRLVPLEKGAVIVEPWDPMYHHKDIDIRTDQLETAVLPVGNPFSRIWYNGDLWRTVGFEETHPA